jgi:hypothetical protein
MIEKAERYKRVCQQITYFADRATDSYNLFIKLTIATIGGYAWLRTHNELGNLLPLARWIIPALAVVTAVEIISDLKSWWLYREAEADLLEKPELKPKLSCFGSGRRELIRFLILIVVGITGFYWLQ